MRKICNTKDLIANSGICVLVDEEQIALFYIDKRVYAVSNYDPIGKANLLSRGIVGDIEGKLVVASPLYKEHFNLKTGECLEDEGVEIKTYKCEIKNDEVYLLN